MKDRLTGLGVAAWAVAAVFGCVQTVRLDGPVAPPAGSNIAPVQRYEVANLTGAAAALGFAVGGGLCFLGAAIADRGPPGRGAVPHDPLSESLTG